MSMRVDSTPLISGSLIVGDAGLGVLAENIPSTGSNGPGYVYDSLDLPADNGKEIIGRIVAAPLLGDFFAYEDTSFDFLNAPDGVHTFTFDVYEDGVFVPPTSTATITIGAGAPTVVNATTGTTTLSAFDASIVESFLPTNINATLASSTLTAFDASIIVEGLPTNVNATLATSQLTAFDASIVSGGSIVVSAALGASGLSAFDATIVYSAPVVVNATLATSGMTAFNATISTGEFYPLKAGRNVFVTKQQRMVVVL